MYAFGRTYPFCSGYRQLNSPGCCPLAHHSSRLSSTNIWWFFCVFLCAAVTHLSCESEDSMLRGAVLDFTVSAPEPPAIMEEECSGEQRGV